MANSQGNSRFVPIPILEPGTVRKSTQETPLVVLVLSDLRGDSPQNRTPTKSIHVDLYNFSNVLRYLRPSLSITTNADGGDLKFQMEFTSIDDFGVANVIRSNPITNELFELRETLRESTFVSVNKAASNPELSSSSITAVQQEINGIENFFGDSPNSLSTLKDEIRSLLERKSPLILRNLALDIVHAIDNWLRLQVTAVIENPCFKDLEQRWLSLYELCKAQNQCSHTEIRLCDITLSELIEDLSKGLRNSNLRNRLEEEYTVGGSPISMILGDFELDIRDPVHIDLMSNFARLCANSFSTFVAAVSPASFGFADFTELVRVRSLETILSSDKYQHWEALRNTPESCHIGLCLPRLRIRYRRAWLRSNNQGFEYQVNGPVAENSLSGNAAYGFVTAVMRAHHATGWPIDCDGALAGKFNDADFPLYGVCQPNASSTGIQVSRELADVASKCGFMLFAHDQQAAAPFVWNAVSINKETKGSEHFHRAEYNRLRISLPHLITASRLAIAARIRANEYSGPIPDLEQFLSNWLTHYIAGESATTTQDKPLTSGKFELEYTPPKLTVRLNLLAGFRYPKPLEYNFQFHLDVSRN